MLNIIANGSDGAPAILAEGKPLLTYSGLREQVHQTVKDLNSRGISRNDRVAIVLPNGPEMAVAFIAIGAGATTAPLNPAYRADEFEFYLRDLYAKALIVQKGVDTPAIEVAHRLNVPVIALEPQPEKGAGRFVFEGAVANATNPVFSRGEDVALVLHTSGTTSRPKIVPLTLNNVSASARNIAATLALKDSDRCLNIMPLFHIHGLIGALLSSLHAGACIFASPGFNALKFFAWMQEAVPTWYTAVPTMHQAILGRAARNAEIIVSTPLRFIRSSSSSLPPQVMAALEEAFRCPVLESYGMTEAAHQMASNPLPPARRIPGSVGIGAGPEVCILGENGKMLPPDTVGEICIRGENVTLGYENNPKANAEAFAGGWFHTGDQGRLDRDGYLYITGRIKEIINRGGEKISPREIDELLLDHAAVEQVVTFAMPHDKLGEEVAAVVVLKEGSAVSERELKDFISARVADFKVPKKIVFLTEIPKGATGKLQRIGLYEKLAEHWA